MPPESREPRVQSRHRSGSCEEGAVAVETAVVSMMLIILLMGIVEASFFFKDWITVSSASRAGARMGASQPKVASFATSTADQVTNTISGLPPTSLAGLQVWVYDANATDGMPASLAAGVAPTTASGTNNCTVKCLMYTWSAGTSKLVPASTPGTWSSGAWSANAGQNACIGDAGRDSLGVYVKFPHHSPLGFIFQNKTVAESTVMWLEPFNPITGCKT
jgi:Flp pilus assembly protein TadG